MLEIERLVASQCELGEGPLWRSDEQALYWLDIYGKKVERFEPGVPSWHTIHMPFRVTSLGLRQGGGFIISAEQGLALWDGLSMDVEWLQRPEENRPYFRFNDGAVAPGGQFFAGSMYDGPDVSPLPAGRLYRLDPDHLLHQVQEDVLISNGLGWSPDGKTMYYTDSLRYTIYAFDYDSASGELDRRRIFVHDPEEPGVPDGLAVDSAGFVWSARWDGWKVTRYDPDGKVECILPMPVQRPTCCMFGGKDLDELYITSAWVGLSESQRQAQPGAGDLYRMRAGVTGLPRPYYRG